MNEVEEELERVISFVVGRNIMENVVIAQVTIHTMDKLMIDSTRASLRILLRYAGYLEWRSRFSLQSKQRD